MSAIQFIIKEKYLLHLAVGIIFLFLGKKYKMIFWSFIILLALECFKEYLDTLNMGRWCPTRSLPDIFFTIIPYITLLKKKKQ